MPGPTSWPPSLTDGVVQLSRYGDDDLAAHLVDEDEETARRFGWWPQSSTEETVRAAFARWNRAWTENGPEKTFAVRDATTGVLLGGCELRRQPDGSGHVSYWTGVTYRQRGHATRALRLLCEYATAEGIAHLEAHIAADNRASQIVAERAGFVLVSFAETDGTVMFRYSRTLKGATVNDLRPTREAKGR